MKGEALGDRGLYLLGEDRARVHRGAVQAAFITHPMDLEMLNAGKKTQPPNVSSFYS